MRITTDDIIFHNMIKPVKVLIISESASFPWGLAAANRVRNLAKGAKSDFTIVEYMGLRGVSNLAPSKEYKKCGIFDGIQYSYPGGVPLRPNNWFLRRLDDFSGVFFSILNVLYQKISGTIDLVIIYSRSFLVVSFWTRFLHLIHVPVVLEVCEWPLAKAESGTFKGSTARKYCYKAIPQVDAVLPISTYIDNEIKKIVDGKHKKIPSFLIPILIDIEPDIFPPKQKSNHPYLLYTGNVGYINIAERVVDIVSELNNRGLKFNLKFTGDGKVYFERLKQYASQKGVLDQIEFTGIVSENRLYEMMGEALALLAPLPEDLMTKARFSTKLGYYLVSGTPVVTNAVGDLAFYLQDGINAFVAKKFDTRQLADKIEQIIKNPAQAKQVGQTGQKLAMEKFHYLSACHGLNDFLQDIINNYKK